MVTFSGGKTVSTPGFSSGTIGSKPSSSSTYNTSTGTYNSPSTGTQSRAANTVPKGTIIIHGSGGSSSSGSNNVSSQTQNNSLASGVYLDTQGNLFSSASAPKGVLNLAQNNNFSDPFSSQAPKSNPFVSTISQGKQIFSAPQKVGEIYESPQEIQARVNPIIARAQANYAQQVFDSKALTPAEVSIGIANANQKLATGISLNKSDLAFLRISGKPQIPNVSDFAPVMPQSAGNDFVQTAIETPGRFIGGVMDAGFEANKSPNIFQINYTSGNKVLDVMLGIPQVNTLTGLGSKVGMVAGKEIDIIGGVLGREAAIVSSVPYGAGKAFAGKPLTREEYNTGLKLGETTGVLAANIVPYFLAPEISIPYSVLGITQAKSKDEAALSLAGGLALGGLSKVGEAVPFAVNAFKGGKVIKVGENIIFENKLAQASSSIGNVFSKNILPIVGIGMAGVTGVDYYLAPDEASRAEVLRQSKVGFAGFTLGGFAGGIGGKVLNDSVFLKTKTNNSVDTKLLSGKVSGRGEMNSEDNLMFNVFGEGVSVSQSDKIGVGLFNRATEGFFNQKGTGIFQNKALGLVVDSKSVISPFSVKGTIEYRGNLKGEVVNDAVLLLENANAPYGFLKSSGIKGSTGNDNFSYGMFRNDASLGASKLLESTNVFNRNLVVEYLKPETKGFKPVKSIKRVNDEVAIKGNVKVLDLFDSVIGEKSRIIYPSKVEEPNFSVKTIIREGKPVKRVNAELTTSVVNISGKVLGSDNLLIRTFTGDNFFSGSRIANRSSAKFNKTGGVDSKSVSDVLNFEFVPSKTKSSVRERISDSKLSDSLVDELLGNNAKVVNKVVGGTNEVRGGSETKLKQKLSTVEEKSVMASSVVSSTVESVLGERTFTRSNIRTGNVANLGTKVGLFNVLRSQATNNNKNFLSNVMKDVTIQNSMIKTIQIQVQPQKTPQKQITKQNQVTQPTTNSSIIASIINPEIIPAVDLGFKTYLPPIKLRNPLVPFGENGGGEKHFSNNREKRIYYNELDKILNLVGANQPRGKQK